MEQHTEMHILLKAAQCDTEDGAESDVRSKIYINSTPTVPDTASDTQVKSAYKHLLQYIHTQY